MRKIRIGNTINVRWSIFVTQGEQTTPYDLTGKNLKLYLSVPYKSRECVADFIVEGNVIVWRYEGKNQRELGIYSLTLVENEGMNGMYTVDSNGAFQLVSSSSLENDEIDDNIQVTTLELTSQMSTVPPQAQVAECLPTIIISNDRDTGAILYSYLKNGGKYGFAYLQERVGHELILIRKIVLKGRISNQISIFTVWNEIGIVYALNESGDIQELANPFKFQVADHTNLVTMASYPYIPGMTWKEWVENPDSGNTPDGGSFTIEDGKVMCGSFPLYLNADTEVYADDEILQDEEGGYYYYNIA